MRYSQLIGLARVTAEFNNSNTSTDIDLKSGALAGISIPAGMVGTALAIHASLEREGTKVFLPVYDDYGNAISIPIGNTARIISMKRLLPLGLSTIRLVSTAAEKCNASVIVQDLLPQ